MKILFVVVMLATLCIAEIQSNGPMVFPSWPPKSNSHNKQSLSAAARHQMIFQLRSSPRYQASPSTMYLSHKRPPPSMPNRIMRPLKMATMPHYYQAKVQHMPLQHHPMHNFFKKPSTHTPSSASGQNNNIGSSSVTKLSFHSSPQGPNSGEYVFENPFAHEKPIAHTPSSVGGLTSTPAISQNSVHHSPLINPQKYSPIHTIPAPNLSLHEQKPFSGPDFLNYPLLDNHIYEKDPHFAFTPQRPSSVHQYQVTESSNDHTIRDPVSGKHTLYAPDPDPSLPSYQVHPASDPFSQPSRQNKLQYDVRFTAAATQQHQQQQAAPSASALVAQPFIQLVNSVAQQQLPDHYGLPLSNQPQLQQHFLQQQYQPAATSQQSVSVYNPTYLVTQSNQLLHQHKQHLFKPEPSFLEQQQQLETDSEFLPTFNVQTVASTGQIQSASQKSNEVVDFGQSANSPQFARLLAPRNTQYGDNFLNLQEQQQPTLSEREVSNLLNFGRIEGQNGQQQQQQQGFIASTYYQTQAADQNVFDVLKHQQQNQDRINQANQALTAEQQHIPEKQSETTNYVTKQPEDRKNNDAEQAHREHQQRLAEHFGSDLRIYVPDLDYATEQTDTFHKRSDDFLNENSAETLETLETLESAASSGIHQNNEIIMSDAGEPASSIEMETTDSSIEDYTIHVEDSMQFNDKRSSSSGLKEELDAQITID